MGRSKRVGHLDSMLHSAFAGLLEKSPLYPPPVPSSPSHPVLEILAALLFLGWAVWLNVPSPVDGNTSSTISEKLENAKKESENEDIALGEQAARSEMDQERHQRDISSSQNSSESYEVVYPGAEDENLRPVPSPNEIRRRLAQSPALGSREFTTPASSSTANPETSPPQNTPSTSSSSLRLSPPSLTLITLSISLALFLHAVLITVPGPSGHFESGVATIGFYGVFRVCEVWIVCCARGGEGLPRYVWIEYRGISPGSGETSVKPEIEQDPKNTAASLATSKHKIIAVVQPQEPHILSPARTADHEPARLPREETTSDSPSTWTAMYYSPLAGSKTYSRLEYTFDYLMSSRGLS